jgi:putative pyoverdin transport system ATP-binding/permease protein
MKLFFWLLQYSPAAMWTAVIAGGVSGATSAAMLATLNSAVNAEDDSFSRSSLGWLFLALLIAAPATRVISAYLIGRFGQTAIHEIRMRISRGILAMPLIDLERQGPERLLVVLTDDLGAISEALTIIPIIFMNASVVIGCLVFLGWLSPVLLATFLVLIAIGIGGYQTPFRWSMRWLRSARQEVASLFLHFRGLLEGNKELKLNHRRQESFLTSLEGSSRTVRGYNLKAIVALSGASSWGQALAFALVGGLVFMPPPGIALSRAIVSSYVLMLLYMVGPIQAVLNSLPALGRANVALRNVVALGVSLSTPSRDATAVAEERQPTNWRLLRLIDVCHTYPGEEAGLRFHTGPLNLTIRPGEIIFLTGGNGSGKSTLAKIIVGLYLPDRGEVLLDDVALGPDTQAQHRSRFTAIFSDYFLFERLFGFEGPDLDARARGYLAQLGLERKVDVERGVLSTTRLSHGQRSRLALLMAYLEDREIYLFDEWASDQDAQFREIFYRQLLPQLKLRSKTVIVVSHDQHYFDIADRIINMIDGQIASDRQPERPAAALASALLPSPS